jgi:hypothetical protein
MHVLLLPWGITPASADVIRGAVFAVFSLRKNRDAYCSPRASYCMVVFSFLLLILHKKSFSFHSLTNDTHSPNKKM